MNQKVSLKVCASTGGNGRFEGMKPFRLPMSIALEEAKVGTCQKCYNEKLWLICEVADGTE
jgi:hypothetical protein